MHQADAFWSAFDRFVAENGERVEASCGAVDEAIERHFEALPRGLFKRKRARDRWARSEAELRRIVTSVRTELRSELVACIPAARGADRPSVDLLATHAAIIPLRLPDVRVSVSAGRLAASAVIGGAVGALLPIVFLGWVSQELATTLTVLLAAAGVAGGVMVTATPLSARARRWLFGGALAMGASVALLYAAGGLGTLVQALRTPAGKKRSAILAAILACAVVLRIWARRPSIDPADVLAAREACADACRRDFTGDLHLVALLAAAAETEIEAEHAEGPLRERLEQVQTEIATALRHETTVIQRDVLVRCSEILGLQTGGPRGPERFVWTGSAEQKSRYRTLGLVRAGQCVRVTRWPVEESIDDEETRIVEQGEVIPDEA